MSTPSPILKRPKLEQRNNEDDNEASLNQKSNENNGREEEDSVEEQKVAFIALIEHRSREVQHLKQRLSYYKTQLVEAEKRLEDSQTKLARLSGRSNASVANKPSVENGIKKVKMERKSPSPVRLNEASSSSQPQSRTELVIPAVNPKVPQTVRSVGSGARISCGSSAQLSSLAPSNGVVNVKVEKPYSAANVKVEKSNSAVKVKIEKCHRSSSDVEVVEIQDRGNKRKIEQKEHKELIPLVSRSSAPCTVHCHTSNHISSQHKRKLRSVAVCPVNDQLFVSRSPTMTNIAISNLRQPPMRPTHWFYNQTREDLIFRTLGKQLRLFDIRLRQTEIHSFGFKQESSDSQSALINQAWSPDGLYLTSGSVDPVIHVFDIRYNYHKPSQSIKAHQKRVFKAVWHYSLPLLISISSDLHIGLHKII
ncbi:hypothetical protein D5086_023645 [Populus alba]|uniref:Uncharacterized protein n=1 Tax=Populus alba TaxID=43335 RepID=A0ACC4BBX8_POPAL